MLCKVTASWKLTAAKASTSLEFHEDRSEHKFRAGRIALDLLLIHMLSDQCSAREPLHRVEPHMCHSSAGFFFSPCGVDLAMNTFCEAIRLVLGMSERWTERRRIRGFGYIAHVASGIKVQVDTQLL